MTGSKKFDPQKRKKLNNPVRLEWLPPALIWDLVGSSSGSTFVDIVLGSFRLIPEIASISGPSVRIHALDIEPLMIEEMQKTLPNNGLVKPQLMEMNQLPFPDDCVDGVWMITLFHELEPAEPLLKEIRRVLRPGGCLLIVDWEKYEEACEHGPPLQHRVAVNTTKQQVTKTGFHNVRIVPGFHCHYGVIGQV